MMVMLVLMMLVTLTKDALILLYPVKITMLVRLNTVVPPLDASLMMLIVVIKMNVLKIIVILSMDVGIRL